MAKKKFDMSTPSLVERSKGWNGVFGSPSQGWAGLGEPNVSATGAAPVTNAGVVPSATATTDGFLAKTYQADLANLAQSKNYLIGNTIGQGLLNMTNLSQAFKDMPSGIGIGNIPRVQYPNITAPMTAELNQALGTYRSGIGRIAGEKGLSPDVRIGAEANALNSELTQRGKIAEAQNASDIAQTTANSVIDEANIANQYKAAEANQTRNDLVEANRSALFSQGLTNAGKIGAGLVEGMIGLNNEKTKLGVTNYYMQQMNKAATAEERNKYYQLYLTSLSREQSKNVIIPNPAANSDFTKKVKD